MYQSIPKLWYDHDGALICYATFGGGFFHYSPSSNTLMIGPLFGFPVSVLAVSPTTACQNCIAFRIFYIRWLLIWLNLNHHDSFSFKLDCTPSWTYDDDHIMITLVISPQILTIIMLTTLKNEIFILHFHYYRQTLWSRMIQNGFPLNSFICLLCILMYPIYFAIFWYDVMMWCVRCFVTLSVYNWGYR